MSGLQPSVLALDPNLGLPAPASKLAGDPVRPRLVCCAPAALDRGNPSLRQFPSCSGLLMVCARSSLRVGRAALSAATSGYSDSGIAIAIAAHPIFTIRGFDRSATTRSGWRASRLRFAGWPAPRRGLSARRRSGLRSRSGRERNARGRLVRAGQCGHVGTLALLVRAKVSEPGIRPCRRPPACRLHGDAHPGWAPAPA